MVGDSGTEFQAAAAPQDEDQGAVALEQAPVAEEAPSAAPVAAAVPTGPRVQRREQWIEIETPPGMDNPYAGFKFRAWVNYPVWMDQQFAKYDVLAQVILEHNGWLDFDGNAYPPASDMQAFWEAIPTELAICVLATLNRAKRALPNSIALLSRS